MNILQPSFSGVWAGRYVMQDPDAIAYVAAVEAAGVTVTNTQRTAIDAFVTTGKGDGWYSSLKRLYLPIWASVAPNAIDMISLTSGTFVGAVTHAVGYVQGDGSTGYFNTQTNLAAAGLTPSDAWAGRLYLDSYAGTGQEGSYQVGASQTFMLHQLTGNIYTELCGFSGGAGRTVTADANNRGIISMFYDSASGTFRQRKRLASERTAVANVVRAAVGTMPTDPPFEMARNSGGVAGTFSTTRRGASWYGLGVTDSADAAFTLALKNLWETCTGLTLP